MCYDFYTYAAVASMYPQEDGRLSPSAAVGCKKGNKQEIALYDYDHNVIRHLEATPQKIDEFLSEKKKRTDKANIAGYTFAAACAIVGAALGYKHGNNKYMKKMENWPEKSYFKPEKDTHLYTMTGVFFGSIVGFLGAWAHCYLTDVRTNRKFINENK